MLHQQLDPDSPPKKQPQLQDLMTLFKDAARRCTEDVTLMKSLTRTQEELEAVGVWAFAL